MERFKKEIRKEIKKVKTESTVTFCKLCGEEFYLSPEDHWIKRHKYPTLALSYETLAYLKSEEEYDEWCLLYDDIDKWEGPGWYEEHGKKVDLEDKTEEYEETLEHYKEKLEELKKYA